jgi:hypothetical protein
MKKVWNEIEKMVASNAVHIRTGVGLQELTERQILEHAQNELNELIQMPEDPTEVADILCCLFHYCQRRNWPQEYIESLMISKLKLRFHNDLAS